MADERRRELRRRRILENSEARREKIFGITKSPKLQETNTDPVSCRPSDIAFTPAFATSTPLLNTNGGPVISQHPQSQEDKHYLINEPLSHSKSSSSSTNYSSTPLTSRENTQLPFRVNSNDLFISAKDPNVNGRSGESSSFPNVASLIGSRNGAHRNRLNRSPVVTDLRLNNTEDFTLGSSFDLNTDSVPATARLSDHALLPCFLALFVCFFLSIGLGDAVFNNLVIPFILFEGQRALWQSWRSEGQGPGGRGGEGTGLLVLLSGINQSLLTRCMAAYSVLDRLSSDLAVYLFTVVLWQVIIGLPQGADDLPQQVAAATMDSELSGEEPLSDAWVNT